MTHDAPQTQEPPPARRRTVKLFLVGLGVRLLGLCLIWLGDGSDSLFHKAVVVTGVVLSVGGIGILKYLLYAGLRQKRPAVPSGGA